MPDPFSHSYVQRSNGEFTPFNVVPSGGIKCTTCHQLFRPDLLEQHLQTHIEPQYRRSSRPSTSASPTRQIDLFDMENE